MTLHTTKKDIEVITMSYYNSNVLFMNRVGTNFSKEIGNEKEGEIFISLAGHELKSLLTSIKAYTQLLQRRFIRNKDTKSYDFLQRLDTQADKLTMLLGDFLDVNKIRGGIFQVMKESFDINKLVNDIATDMQFSTQQKIIVQGKVDEMVFADKDRLKKVITHFLDNAIKYAPEGKKIIIQLKQINSQFEVEVRDFGKGMSLKEQKQVFDLFNSVKQKNQAQGKGLGIGLFLAKAIIMEHKGTIGVKKIAPRGNVFFFRLPLQAH